MHNRKTAQPLIGAALFTIATTPPGFHASARQLSLKVLGVSRAA
jgi:hypothetical protein